jgi:hypothetical protein
VKNEREKKMSEMCSHLYNHKTKLMGLKERLWIFLHKVEDYDFG